MAFELGKWSASAVGLVCHPAYIPWRRASQRANMPVRELADRIVSNAVKEEGYSADLVEMQGNDS